ncbi:MAG: hypothetical protein KC668_23625 [Myxococcales bacterium]|nr:hypothetical protein [Myxococcales bacterium]
MVRLHHTRATALALTWLLSLAACASGCAGSFDDYYAGDGGPPDGSADGMVPDAASDADIDMETADFGMGPFDLDVTVGGTGTGGVVSAPSGINCGSDCEQTYDAGTTVTLIATPVAPAVVVWGGACAGTAPEDPCVISMTRPRSVTVDFAIPTFTLTVIASGGGTGQVVAADDSLDCDGTGTCAVSYQVGTMVTLSALPGFASSFSGWSMDCAGLGDCELTMDADKTVGVTFDDADEVSLLISRSGSGMGTVTSAPTGIDCGASCSAVFAPGEEITLTATETAGSTFMGWSGDCTGTGMTCTLTMSAARSVTATFDVNTYMLSVARDGTGSGSVSSVPAAIDCGATCSAPYAHGTNVVLIAAADEGSTFTGWAGACQGTNTFCSVPITAAATATATFTRDTYTLTAAVTGAGKIVSGAGGIDCGSDCSETYAHGQMVTLNAIANDGAAFTGWSGACAAESSTSCVVTLTQAESVGATFAINQYALTASTTDNGSGTITSSDGSIDCGSDCTGAAGHGDSITFTATADAGSTFIGWGGDCAGEASNVCTLTIAGATSVSAAFVLGNEFLTVTKSGTGAGTVASDVPGIDCGSTCASSFTNGTMVTLTATPATGSTFTGWSGGCMGASTTCSVTVTTMVGVTAQFTADQHTLQVVPTGEGTGTVSNNTGSILCGTGGMMCSDTVNYGVTRTLTASADANSVFVGWSGADCPGTAPCVISMTDDVTVQALFDRAPYVLTVATGGTGTGSVVSDVAGINCGTDCTETYRHGDVVTLTATATANSDFNGWSGAGCGASTTCVVTVTQAQTVTAQFTLKQYTLTVTKPGNGAGTVSSTPAGISCGASCSGSYAHGTMVMLTATPSTGSDFTGWGGACSGTTSCMVTMDQAQSVTATFTLRQYTLTVNRAGTGSGSVSSTPSGLTCPANGSCTGTFNHGTTVQLIASPASSSDFTSWSGGGCSSNGACNVTMTAATAVTATFTLKQQPLTVTVSGSGSGTVSSNPAGISCTKTGGTCAANYTHGTMVTLTATPTSGGGNTFAAWGGACTGQTGSTCTLSMTQANSVSATFTVGSNNLTVSVNGTGTVTSSPTGISCTSTGGTCSQSFTFGQTVTLTAAPGVGRTFSGWGGACASAGTNTTCQVTMDASKSVTATFEVLSYTLTTVIDAQGFGSVITPGGEIDCPGDCTESLPHGEMITLQAVPTSGYVFDGWVDDGGGSSAPCSDLNPVYCTLTITQARTIRAKFSPVFHTVTVSRSGSGSITSSPGSINCGSNCSGSFATGTSLQLTASPASGNSFSAWTGACAGQGAVCTLNIAGPVSTQAVFTPNTYPVSVSFVGLNVGDVSTTDGVITCLANGQNKCSGTYTHGSAVTFVAADIDPRQTSPGARFVRWSSGPCAGSTNTSCATTVTAALSVQAEYIRTYALVVDITGGALTSNERVNVQIGPLAHATTCSSTMQVGYVPPPCTFAVEVGVSVTLSALPAAGFFRFNNWVPPPSGCSASNPSCMFTMPSAAVLTAANFD